MNILFICAGHGLDDDRVTRKEALSLTRMGHRVTVCAQWRRPYSERPVELYDVDTMQLVNEETRLDNITMSHVLRAKRIPKLLKLYKKAKPDLIVAHEFETACLAWWIKKRYGTQYVFDAHEGYEYTVPLATPKIMRWLTVPLARWMLRMVVRGAAGITAASPGALTYQLGVRYGKPTAVLHNAPLMEYFPYTEEETDPITIVHEGNLSLDRGALEIIDAIAIVSRTHKCKLLILGTVEASVKNLLDKKIEEYGLGDVVKMAGRLPWDEFGKVETTGQIGLICMQPLKNNMTSLSNKLYNYMACGLAVLAMKGSQTEQIINEVKSGICVDTTSPREIANGIIWLIEHPNERRLMAKNGRSAMENVYGWHKMEHTMKETYSKIMKELT